MHLDQLSAAVPHRKNNPRKPFSLDGEWMLNLSPDLISTVRFAMSTAKSKAAPYIQTDYARRHSPSNSLFNANHRPTL